MTTSPDERALDGVYTVSQINSEIRTLLETSFPLIWVQGELSNLARPSSGHLYFSLKDSAAQVRCAMFRSRNQLLRFRPQDGAQVLVRARVGLYEARGDYQLIVEHLETAGDGALRLAFEALKERLAREGLFAADRKHPLPQRVRRLGVITSPDGAAIRDILTVLRRRFPALPVLLYPIPVQGDKAAPAIAEAIGRACQDGRCDALIVARGGGSLEDLWAFNDEKVARAIAECPTPVISGVGHEVDITIADLVADLRAPTPSAAAEAVSPDSRELLAHVQRNRARLERQIRLTLRELDQRLGWLRQRLHRQHPERRLQQQGQRVDELEQRLHRAWQHSQTMRASQLERLDRALRRASPTHRIQRLEAQRQALERRLLQAASAHLRYRRGQLEGLTRALHDLSPLATLARGYAVVIRPANNEIVRDSATVAVGERVHAYLANGSLTCQVEASGPGYEDLA